MSLDYALDVRLALQLFAPGVSLLIALKPFGVCGCVCVILDYVMYICVLCVCKGSLL